MLRHAEGSEEEMLAKQFCDGFKMAGWNTVREVMAALEEAGFANIRYIDKTKAVGKSIVDIWRISCMVSPLFMLKYIGLVSETETENLLATYSQKKMYEKGLVGYGIFVAEKPAH